ncbi:MAG: sugar phosphate isomerase/epimerase [Acidobacteriota bacterium]
MTTRRTFLSASALAGPALSLASSALQAAAGKHGFVLGVASYSLRKFPREKAIEMIKACHAPYVSIKSMHLEYKSMPAEFALAKKQFKDAGITILSGGNIDLKGDDAELRAMFEYAKAAGFPTIVCAPSHKTVGAVEKLVKEYNIKAAIHNHGPEDKEFPTPQSVLDAVKGMDPRMGLCIDIGHTSRTGADIVESIANAGPRLFDMHFKDLADPMSKDSQVAVGEGKLPIPAIFAQLKKQGYNRGCMLEYEIKADDPLPGMIKSFDYMRSVLAKV